MNITFGLGFFFSKLDIVYMPYLKLILKTLRNEFSCLLFTNE